MNIFCRPAWPSAVLLLGCLILISSVPTMAQRPVLGEQPQTVEDIYVPKVEGVEVETWVDNLRVPWALCFLPNGDALVTERPGRILRIPQGDSEPLTYLDVDAHHDGDSGLMGMALDPDFEHRPYVYIMYSYERDGRQQSRVHRLKHRDTHAVFDRVVLDGLSALRYHIGGRIVPTACSTSGPGTLGIRRFPRPSNHSTERFFVCIRMAASPRTTPSPARLSFPMVTV